MGTPSAEIGRQRPPVYYMEYNVNPYNYDSSFGGGDAAGGRGAAAEDSPQQLGRWEEFPPGRTISARFPRSSASEKSESEHSERGIVRVRRDPPFQSADGKTTFSYLTLTIADFVTVTSHSLRHPEG